MPAPTTTTSSTPSDGPSAALVTFVERDGGVRREGTERDSTKAEAPASVGHRMALLPSGVEKPLRQLANILPGPQRANARWTEKTVSP